MTMRSIPKAAEGLPDMGYRSPWHKL